jgi:hypothetical protein
VTCPLGEPLCPDKGVRVGERIDRDAAAARSLTLSPRRLPASSTGDPNGQVLRPSIDRGRGFGSRADTLYRSKMRFG